MTVEDRLRHMRSADPCICGSSKAWGRCCAVYSERKDSIAVYVKRAGGPLIRFFLQSLSDPNEMYRDSLGEVLVFLSRAQAQSLKERLDPKGGIWGVSGMTEFTWERFKKAVPQYAVVSGSVAQGPLNLHFPTCQVM